MAGKTPAWIRSRSGPDGLTVQGRSFIAHARDDARALGSRRGTILLRARALAACLACLILFAHPSAALSAANAPASTAVLGTTVPTGCALLLAAAEAAAQIEDWALLETRFSAALQDPACTPTERQQIGQRLADLGERQVTQALAAGDPLTRWQPVLARSAAAAPHWRLESWLADLARDQGRFTVAARHYYQALRLLDQPLPASVPLPDPSLVARLLHRAEQTRLLADQAVPLAPIPQPRHADAPPPPVTPPPPAAAAPSTPPAVRQRTILPIAFQFDTTAFTPKGAAAAADLLAFLREQGSPPVTLIGHSDDQGDPAHNQRLSLRRAEAVRAYLLSQGYRGAIQAEGRGSGEPLPLTDAGPLTPAQRRQAQRRVEMLR